MPFRRRTLTARTYFDCFLHGGALHRFEYGVPTALSSPSSVAGPAPPRALTYLAIDVSSEETRRIPCVPYLAIDVNTEEMRCGPRRPLPLRRRQRPRRRGAGPASPPSPYARCLVPRHVLHRRRAPTRYAHPFSSLVVAANVLLILP